MGQIAAKRGDRALTGLPRPLRKELATFARKLARDHRALFAAEIGLLREFRHQYPNEKPADHWKRVYPLVIPNYQGMSEIEQKDARAQLRERVRWRKRIAKRITH